MAEAGGAEGGLALLADPEAPGLRAALERAAGQPTAVLGPTVELLAARRSAERARELRRLIAAGRRRRAAVRPRRRPPRRAVAHGDELALAELAAPRLAPLAGETPASRARLTETLRAWLDHQGEVRGSRPSSTSTRRPCGTGSAGCGSGSERRSTIPAARFELALALRSPVSAPGSREAERPKRELDFRLPGPSWRRHGRRSRRRATMRMKRLTEALAGVETVLGGIANSTPISTSAEVAVCAGVSTQRE